MADEVKTETNEVSFADLLDAYGGGRSETLKPGDKISGRVISIGEDSVYVDTGTKIDGVVDKSELANEAGELTIAEGDTVDLYVVAIQGNTVSLSKAMAGAGGLDALHNAFENKIPVEGRVVDQCKGGYNVRVMGRRAFCPVSQIDSRYVSTPEEYVGQTYKFQIIKFENNGRNLVVSRRVLLEQEKSEATARFLEEITPGTVVEGTIMRLASYGAFIEIAPGIEGMAHISELGWSRVENPAEVVSPGDQVPVKILSIEPSKDKQGRPTLKISLSMKQAQADPWDGAAGKFAAGDKVEGKVTRIAPFGAFVEIAPGIEGLVHVSEMSYTRRIHKPEDVVQPGDSVTVAIKEFDADKRRVSLSLREVEGDPWGDVPERFKVGSSVQGAVEKKEQFGWFITLAPGVTGLLPKSRIAKAAKPAEVEKLNVGDAITVVVEELRTSERKITLTLGDTREEGDWKRFAKPEPPKESPMGTLGEKLQAALKAKR